MKKTYFAPQTEVSNMLIENSFLVQSGDVNMGETNPNPGEEGGAAKGGIWDAY